MVYYDADTIADALDSDIGRRPGARVLQGAERVPSGWDSVDMIYNPRSPEEFGLTVIAPPEG